MGELDLAGTSPESLSSASQVPPSPSVSALTTKSSSGPPTYATPTASYLSWSRADYDGSEVVYIFEAMSIGYLYLEMEIDFGPGNILIPLTEVFGSGVVEPFAFAHFSPHVAYLDTSLPGVIVADLSGENKVVYPLPDGHSSTQADEPAYTFIQWSPDDEYIFLRALEHSTGEAILSLSLGTAESWKYTCNAIAKSPRTSWYAIWCSSNDTDEFAVFEWGEGVWFSQAPPTAPVIELGEGVSQAVYGLDAIAAWSANGQRIAFFDPTDESGRLHIRGTDGLFLDLLPGGNYMTSLPGDIAPYSFPIQWSENGSRLLVLARGQEKEPCPTSHFDPGGRSMDYPNAPCWHVVDVENGGSVVWRQDSINRFTRVDDPFAYQEAAISGDGRYLALDYQWWGEHRLIMIDLENNALIRGSGIPATALRWGPPIPNN